MYCCSVNEFVSQPLPVGVTHGDCLILVLHCISSWQAVPGTCPPPFSPLKFALLRYSGSLNRASPFYPARITPPPCRWRHWNIYSHGMQRICTQTALQQAIHPCPDCLPTWQYCRITESMLQEMHEGTGSHQDCHQGAGAEHCRADEQAIP